LNDTTTAQVTEIVADALEVTPEEVAQFGELADVDGWDSLRRLNVMMALEESLGVVMSPDDLLSMTSIPRIAEIVLARQT
jgi:acyl carrier protein